MSAQLRQTRAQRMARVALDCVRPVADGKFAGDYKPRAMGFPAHVLQSGLAQAVGFVAAKSGGKRDNAYGLYLDHLAKVTGRDSGEALLKDAVNTNLAGYRLLTREVLDASSWLKRFTQTLVKDAPMEDGRGA